MKQKLTDGHMHLAQWERDGKNIFENLNEYMQNAGINAVDNMCCSNNADLWYGFEADQSILGAIAKLENPNVFTHGCLFLPRDYTKIKDCNFRDQLDELMEVGLDGIKICDFKPDAYKLFNIDAHLRKYDDFIGYCEKNNVHMCWHIADPDYFWDAENVPESAVKKGWFYGNKTFPTYEKLIDMTYGFLERHPKLNVCLAHMFFKYSESDEVAALLEKYPNVCLDMAPAWEMFDGFREYYDKWYELFRRYSTRFIYATDMTLPNTLDYLVTSAQHVLKFLKTNEEFEVSGNRFTKGIKLEREHLDNILYKNHENTVGKIPREINRKALKKYIERYLPIIPDSRNKQLTEEYYRKNLI